MREKQELINSKCRDDWEKLILQWVHDELGRNLLTRHLLDGKHYEELAEEFDVSRATVYNKITECSKQLFKHCN